MHFVGVILDDLMHEVFETIVKLGVEVPSSNKGSNIEINGVSLELKNPRARLSRTETKGTVFSCLGELLWYLSGSNDLSFISYYIPGYEKFSDDGKTVYGAYGPRVFGPQSQFKRVAGLLKEKLESRKAVIQIFDRKDIIEKHEDVPCTCTLQFLIRSGQLTLVSHMRSNDAFLGLPHDLFSFSMIQELMARTVGVEIGSYKHLVGSLHLYDRNLEQTKDYLREGWQSTIQMPAMPAGDPQRAVDWLLEVEVGIRNGVDVSRLMKEPIDPYWMDLARILRAYACAKSGDLVQLDAIKREMHSSVFIPYLLKRLDAVASRVQ